MKFEVIKAKPLTATPRNNSRPSVRWTQFDTYWTLSLFGTAVGAGILFLPINAGLGGFWPLLLLTLIVGPMTYLAHLGLCRFVLSSAKPGSDLSEVVTEHFGPSAGKVITLLYFLSIYPILLIYGVGVTNTIQTFLIHQLNIVTVPRSVLAVGLILILVLIMQAREQRVLRITQWMVYPLVAMLASISLYLIPSWNLASLRQIPSITDFSLTLWLTIPVLVFSFNHSPAISSFALAQQRQYGQIAEDKARWILRRTAIMLLFFVMFFVFSCVLSLTSAELSAAKQQNISILSYLANQQDKRYLAHLGPIIALLAIMSSFFGHYRGAYESLHSLLSSQCSIERKINVQKKLDRCITLFFLLSLWAAAVFNPNILGMIESLSGPVIAIILFIVPLYALYTVPCLRCYCNRYADLFTLILGTIAISATVYSLIR